MHIKEGSIMDIAVETDLKTLATLTKETGFPKHHRSSRGVPHKSHRSLRGVTKESQRSLKRFLEDH